MADIFQAATPELLDRYELIALLAKGGMGSVHLARLPGAGGFQRLYAIKVMHPHLATESDFVAMLLDEARIAARIHHPNAVPIVDICNSDKGFYLVMDYIEGVTLGQWFSAKAPWKTRVRIGLRAVVDALAGLHAAHELTDDEGVALGIVHRDVSPQNIMIGSDGAGRITDFGIALAASRIQASRPGLIKGKPAYMSPEQVSAAPVDRRADLFAMGIVLWETLAGKRLFDADQDVGALMQVVSAEIVPPSSVVPEIPAGLDAVCMQALQRGLDDRYPTARAMGLALEEAADAAELLATTHETADELRARFADPFATRRAVIRNHVRGSVGAPRMPGSDEASSPGIRSGSSIPAVEVNSKVPLAVQPATPSQPARAPKPSRTWGIVAGVGIVAAVSGALAVTAATRHATPVPPTRTVSPVAAVRAEPLPHETPAAPAIPEARPEPSAPVAVPVVETPVVVAVAPVAATRGTPVSAVPAAGARVPPRRVTRDASVAAHPAIEANPYLQR